MPCVYLKKMGESALSAVGIVTPIYYVANIIGALFGIGGSIAISYCNGSGEVEKTRFIFTKSISWLVVIGLVMTVGGLLFLRPLTVALGGLPGNMEYAETYLGILLVGITIYTINFAGAYFLANDNAPTLAMYGTVVSNLVNIFIDVLFVSVLGYGIAAAAWGTIIGEIACCGGILRSFLMEGTFMQV